MEQHPFPPFIPNDARLLICGTFPPKQNRWSMEFYYPNFINDMWRVFGLIFFSDKEKLVDSQHKTFRKEEIIKLLEEKGIALSDTGSEVVRSKDNAADKFLQIEKPFDLKSLLMRMPFCHDVATTGEKAAGVIADITGTSIPKMGDYVDCILNNGDAIINFRHWRMPSTSRAYPMKIENKAAFYAKMFKCLDLITE